MPRGAPPAAKINTARRARRFQRHQFPSTLGGFGIVMSFYEYSYDAAMARGLTTVDGEVGVRGSAKASIMLPLPLNLTDSYGVQVQGIEMGALGAAALDVAKSEGIGEALNAINDAGAKAGEFVRGFVGAGSDRRGGDAINATQYFLRSTIDSLFQGAGSALSVANGTAINPHIALTFEGVDLKQYSFSWRLAPKNPEEAESIRSIINTLRMHSLPEFESVGGGATSSLRRGLLKYPSLVQPHFVGIDANYFWSFKPCMISNITVNYAPEGVAVQAGGKPAILDLEVQMTETTIHTRGDYMSDGSVGMD